MCSSALLYGMDTLNTTTGAITLGPILNEIHNCHTVSEEKTEMPGNPYHHITET